MSNQPDAFAGDILQVPAHERTPEMCIAAVKRNVWALDALTPEQRTAEVYLAAVQHDSLAIRWIDPVKAATDQALSEYIDSNWNLLAPEFDRPEDALAWIQAYSSNTPDQQAAARPTAPRG